MSRLSRRRFLEDSMFATAAAIAAAGTRRAYAQEAAGASGASGAKKAAASDRLRVAVVGVNGRGMSHVRDLSGRPDTEVAIICDADESTFEKARKMVESKSGKAPDLPAGPAQGAGGQVDRRRHHRDAQPLARAGGDLGDPGGQGRVRREAGQPQRARGPDGGASSPASTGGSCRPARRAAATRACASSSSTSARASWARSRWRAGSATSGARPSARSAPAASRPRASNYDLWLGRRQARKDVPRDSGSTTTGTGSGTTATATSATRASTRWTRPAGAWARARLPTSVISLGGRFGYEDDGETPNTQLCFYDYGDAQLVFEVRGLETEGLQGREGGQHLLRPEGYAVSNSYSSGTIFDLKGQKVTSFDGDGPATSTTSSRRSARASTPT